MGTRQDQSARYPIQFGALAPPLNQQLGVPMSKEFRKLQRDADAVCRLAGRHVLNAAERDRAEVRLARRAAAAAEKRKAARTGSARRTRARRPGATLAPGP